MQTKLQDPDTPEGMALTEEIRQIVNSAIEALPEELKTAIVLRELDGLSYEEIAAAMECPVGTVRSRIFERARPSTSACAKYLKAAWAAPRKWYERGTPERESSQLSAMFDGELPGAECELLARRLTRDEALRAQWSRFSMIGAALRAERGVALHDRVAWRVQSTVAQEATYGDGSVDTAATPPVPRSLFLPASCGSFRRRAGRVSRVRSPVPALPPASPRCPSSGCVRRTIADDARRQRR